MPNVSRDGRLSDKSKTACFTVTKSTKWKIVTLVPTPTNQAIVIIPVLGNSYFCVNRPSKQQ